MIGKKKYTKIEMKLEGTGYDEARLYSGTAYLRLRGNSTAGLTDETVDSDSGRNDSLLTAAGLLPGFAAVGAIVIVIFKKKQNVRE